MRLLATEESIPMPPPIRSSISTNIVPLLTSVRGAVDKEIHTYNEIHDLSQYIWPFEKEDLFECKQVH